MAKIVQVLTRPSVEYDYTVAEAQTRDCLLYTSPSPRD